MVEIDVGANEWISMDHTFNVACNIEVKRKSDNKWETLYDSLFSVMNEKGQVMDGSLQRGLHLKMSETSYKGLRDVATKRNKLCKPVILITAVLGEENFRVFLQLTALLN